MISLKLYSIQDKTRALSPDARLRVWSNSVPLPAPVRHVLIAHDPRLFFSETQTVPMNLKILNIVIGFCQVRSITCITEYKKTSLCRN